MREKQILTIFNNDGTTTEVEPIPLSHPCNEGKKCYCGFDPVKNDKMKSLIAIYNKGDND